MFDGSVIVALLSGAFALVGGYVGARLTRRIDHEKWLRQQRSIAFAEFFRQLHAVLKGATPILCGSEPRLEQDRKLTELFMELNAQEYIVRLYLPAIDRDSFSKLKKDLWLLHDPPISAGPQTMDVKETVEKIQSLFERTLDGQSSRHSAGHGEAKNL